LTFSEKFRKRVERLTLTAVSKTFLTWAIATTIFILFVGKEGWAEYLAFTAAVCGFVGYKELKGGGNNVTPDDNLYP
jgi:hypothetical protein